MVMMPSFPTSYFYPSLALERYDSRHQEVAQVVSIVSALFALIFSSVRVSQDEIQSDAGSRATIATVFVGGTNFKADFEWGKRGSQWESKWLYVVFGSRVHATQFTRKRNK